MTLANTVTAYADVVSDAVEGATGKPVTTALRYHGGPVPDACCTEDGIVSAWVTSVKATIDFPFPVPLKGSLQGSKTLVELGAKWSTCWPVPKLDTDNQPVSDFSGWDAAAARLEQVAEAVTYSLIVLSCANPRSLHEDLGGPCGGFRFDTCRPNNMDRAGGCAGWTWTALAALENLTIS